jgi:glycerophosphoryl diester phosphodiesterase
MPIILAHRGNTQGPSRSGENRLPAIREALANGWGLEIDIRRAADGRFYLSHDRQESADNGLLAEIWCAELRRHPHVTVALNIKELGYESALLAFLEDQDVLRQVFLFDMELLEESPGETACLFRTIHRHVAVAARVSDRGESIEHALTQDESRIIWLDEFDRPWATGADVARLIDHGRIVFAVSPDLHGGSIDEARRRWVDFTHWGVHGICTDYPADLEHVLNVETLGVAV